MKIKSIFISIIFFFTIFIHCSKTNNEFKPTKKDIIKLGEIIISEIYNPGVLLPKVIVSSYSNMHNSLKTINSFLKLEPAELSEKEAKIWSLRNTFLNDLDRALVSSNNILTKYGFSNPIIIAFNIKDEKKNFFWNKHFFSIEYVIKNEKNNKKLFLYVDKAYFFRNKKYFFSYFYVYRK